MSLCNVYQSFAPRFSKSVTNWKSSDSISVKLKIHNPYSAAIKII